MSEMPTPKALPQSAVRRKLWLLFLLCLAPVVASYVSYYLIRPSARSNYGDLIEPQRAVPRLALSTLDGRPYDLAALDGKWLMLMVDGGDCERACQDKLYQMRQVRLTTGKDRDRVERVWLISDRVPLSTLIMREYDGTQMLRADPAELRAWLPATAATSITDHIYVIDPHAHLMMRFPNNADPSRIKRDIARLLAASSIG